MRKIFKIIIEIVLKSHYFVKGKPLGWFMFTLVIASLYF